MKKVLLLEEKGSDLGPLRDFLTQEGYDVQTVHTVEEALLSCQKNPPQIILTDLYLPDGSTLKLLQKVRETATGIAFILMAEKEEIHVVLEALHLGADDYLFKPISDFKMVLSTLERQLKRHPVGGRTLSYTDLAMCEKVEKMLEAGEFRMAFQPILVLKNRSVFGYEALLRPGPSSPFPQPGPLFDFAKRVGMGRMLDLACVGKALATAPKEAPRLFVNVETETLVEPDSLLKLVSLAERPSASIVLEVTERGTVANLDYLAGPCEVLRNRKIDLAVDDVGSGFASMERILNIRPQFLKIAMSITRNVDTDSIRRAMAEMILYMGGRISAQVIAEGVETEAELALLKTLGVELGQGYLLSPKV